MSRARLSVIAALTAALLAAVGALSGVAAPPPGKGKGKGKGKASAAQYKDGTGKAHGKSKVSICHKGKTIRVAQPAVKAHLRHGDKLGSC